MLLSVISVGTENLELWEIRQLPVWGAKEFLQWCFWAVTFQDFSLTSLGQTVCFLRVRFSCLVTVNQVNAKGSRVDEGGHYCNRLQIVLLALEQR